VIAIVDGNDVFGVAAVNRATMVVFGVSAAVLLVLAMMPRVGRRRDRVVEGERDPAMRRRRFGRDRARDDETRVEEPAGTTERRV
jgi:hypothetical protein